MSLRLKHHNETNWAYWESVKHKYPFRAKTRPQRPRPTDMDKETYGDFLAIPVKGVVLWGFQTELACAVFVSERGATYLTPKDEEVVRASI